MNAGRTTPRPSPWKCGWAKTGRARPMAGPRKWPPNEPPGESSSAWRRTRRRPRKPLRRTTHRVVPGAHALGYFLASFGLGPAEPDGSVGVAEPMCHALQIIHRTVGFTSGEGGLRIQEFQGDRK